MDGRPLSILTVTNTNIIRLYQHKYTQIYVILVRTLLSTIHILTQITMRSTELNIIHHKHSIMSCTFLKNQNNLGSIINSTCRHFNTYTVCD